MANSSNQIGTVIAIVFITLLISGAGMYFGLPALFPNMNEDLSDLVDSDELETELGNYPGIILQTQIYENDTTTHIGDGHEAVAPMPNTAMNFTTQGGSKIKVSFDAMFVLPCIQIQFLGNCLPQSFSMYPVADSIMYLISFIFILPLISFFKLNTP